MDQTGTDGSHEVGHRSVQIPTAETEEDEEVSTTDEQKKQLAMDDVLKCLSPLIMSVRPLGLYFTRGPADASEHDRKRVGGCRDWSVARVCATVMLAVTYINAARNFLIVDGTETVGELFTKLGTNSGVLLTAFLHTTYYVACHTGSLARVFREVDTSKPDFRKRYSRRVTVVIVVCWLLVAIGIMYYVFVSFTRDYFEDILLTFIVKTFRLSTRGLYAAKVFSALLQIPSIAIITFTQAMNRASHSIFGCSLI